LKSSKTARKVYPHKHINLESIKCADEIILSSGTIGSPVLLMRSGITTKQNPAIGKNLTDHLILSLEFEMNSSFLSHENILEDPDLLASAEKNYQAGKKGDLVKFGGSSGVIFPKLKNVYTSKEFTDIVDSHTREFLTHPARPTTEIWFMVTPLHWLISEWSCLFPSTTEREELYYV
jgi:choline dehydrogenase-like flavoprotein